MKKLTTLLLIVLAATAGALGSQVFSDRSSASTPEEPKGLDTREVVHFNEEQTHFALTQMRGLLDTLVSLDGAEVSDDLEAMAAYAAAQGPGQVASHPEGFHEAMPDGFRAMSRQMRQGFRQAATAAQSGDPGAYVTAKRQVQSTCLACHETYRIVERP